MSKLPAFVQTIARRDERDVASLQHYVRVLRHAGLIRAEASRCKRPGRARSTRTAYRGARSTKAVTIESHSKPSRAQRGRLVSPIVLDDRAPGAGWGLIGAAH